MITFPRGRHFQSFLREDRGGRRQQGTDRMPIHQGGAEEGLGFQGQRMSSEKLHFCFVLASPLPSSLPHPLLTELYISVCFMSFPLSLHWPCPSVPALYTSGIPLGLHQGQMCKLFSKHPWQRPQNSSKEQGRLCQACSSQDALGAWEPGGREEAQLRSSGFNSMHH